MSKSLTSLEHGVQFMKQSLEFFRYVNFDVFFLNMIKYILILHGRYPITYWEELVSSGITWFSSATRWEIIMGFNLIYSVGDQNIEQVIQYKTMLICKLWITTGFEVMPVSHLELNSSISNCSCIIFQQFHMTTTRLQGVFFHVDRWRSDNKYFKASKIIEISFLDKKPLCYTCWQCDSNWQSAFWYS